MKKILSFVLAILFVLLAGCSDIENFDQSQNSESNESGLLSFWDEPEENTSEESSVEETTSSEKLWQSNINTL